MLVSVKNNVSYNNMRIKENDMCKLIPNSFGN